MNCKKRISINFERYIVGHNKYEILSNIISEECYYSLLDEEDVELYIVDLKSDEEGTVKFLQNFRSPKEFFRKLLPNLLVKPKDLENEVLSEINKN